MGLPVDESRIAEAERELGIVFPPELRERLTLNNGGDIYAESDSWILNPVWDPTDRKTATRSANHIVRETQFARSWRGFPPDAIAVASDGSGDVIVFLPSTRHFHLWLHETRELEDVDISWDADPDENLI
jgi:hypothetical protein